MAVKAKFKCQSITDYGNNKQVKLSAVHGHQGENADYAKYTPYGEIVMTIDNETAAVDFFKPQKEYYLTFEEA